MCNGEKTHEPPIFISTLGIDDAGVELVNNKATFVSVFPALFTSFVLSSVIVIIHHLSMKT